MTPRRLILTALAVLAVSGASIAFAGGSVPTTLTMRNSAPAFHGKVKSDLPACRPDRRVKLFRENASGARTLLGRTDSGDRGQWLIPVDPLTSGGYIAKVKQHIVSINGVPLRCEPDFAPGIFVD